MKNLDLFSKRILTVSISFGIILLSLSIFLVSLSTVSKSFATVSAKVSPQQQRSIIVGDYTIIGAIQSTNGKTYAVGFDDKKISGEKVQTYR